MKRMGRSEIADPLRRGFRIFKAQGESAILPWVIEHVAAVRSEGDGQPQLLCGLDKGARLVSRGRAQHEKSSWLGGAHHGWPNHCNHFNSRAQPLARCTLQCVSARPPMARAARLPSAVLWLTRSSLGARSSTRRSLFRNTSLRRRTNPKGRHRPACSELF